MPLQWKFATVLLDFNSSHVESDSSEIRLFSKFMELNQI